MIRQMVRGRLREGPPSLGGKLAVGPLMWHEADSDSVAMLVSEIRYCWEYDCTMLSVPCITASKRDSS